MRTYLVIMSLTCFLTVSCNGGSKASTNGNKATIRTFEQLSNFENQQVSISGFLSKTHGASGLYFNLNDLDNENENCIALVPFVGEEHAMLIELTGMLVVSECKTDIVCLNVCSDYKLLNPKRLE